MKGGRRAVWHTEGGQVLYAHTLHAHSAHLQAQTFAFWMPAAMLLCRGQACCPSCQSVKGSWHPRPPPKRHAARECTCELFYLQLQVCFLHAHKACPPSLCHTARLPPFIVPHSAPALLHCASQHACPPSLCHTARLLPYIVPHSVPARFIVPHSAPPPFVVPHSTPAPSQPKVPVPSLNACPFPLCGGIMGAPQWQTETVRACLMGAPQRRTETMRVLLDAIIPNDAQRQCGHTATMHRDNVCLTWWAPRNDAQRQCVLDLMDAHITLQFMGVRTGLIRHPWI